jgi:crossover junction endodeoxyribonuclease RuvC
LKIIAIDPGAVSAAYAILDPNHPPICADMPVVDRMVNAVVWSNIIREAQPDVAVIEQVGPMPKQGASSGFRFGMGVGLIRGVLSAHLVPVIQVHSTKWKRFYGLHADKEASRALAIRLFPEAAPSLTRKKDHGRAEALLLAHWYKENHK